MATVSAMIDFAVPEDFDGIRDYMGYMQWIFRCIGEAKKLELGLIDEVAFEERTRPYCWLER